MAFRWKDYRVKNGDRQKVMHLATPDFIRRFLMHVLPDGFHRIRHYGLLASGIRKTNLAKYRALLCVRPPEQASALEAEPECGATLLVNMRDIEPRKEDDGFDGAFLSP